MAKAAKTYTVSVENKEYCGVGAGGAHFAHGEAVIADERLANWFKEHKGYTVTEVKEPEEPKKSEDK